MNAILFPGQGSQKVGMGKGHFNSNKKFQERVKQADDLLRYSLSQIMFQNPYSKQSSLNPQYFCIQ